MTLRIAINILIIGASLQLSALDNTIQNRIQQADRYLATYPPSEGIADILIPRAKDPNPEKEKAQIEIITKYLNYQQMYQVMKDALIQVFTADELSAMADFYGSPAGKSVMKKMNIYSNAMEPGLKKEIGRAILEYAKVNHVTPTN